MILGDFLTCARNAEGNRTRGHDLSTDGGSRNNGKEAICLFADRHLDLREFGTELRFIPLRITNRVHEYLFVDVSYIIRRITTKVRMRQCDHCIDDVL